MSVFSHHTLLYVNMNSLVSHCHCLPKTPRQKWLTHTVYCQSFFSAHWQWWTSLSTSTKCMGYVQPPVRLEQKIQRGKPHQLEHLLVVDPLLYYLLCFSCFDLDSLGHSVFFLVKSWCDLLCWKSGVTDKTLVLWHIAPVNDVWNFSACDWNR